jgi:outer membrane protein
MAPTDEVVAALRRCRPAFLAIVARFQGALSAFAMFRGDWGMWGLVVQGLKAVAIAALASGAAGSGRASAETLQGALAKAFLNNPQLNAQRAVVRQASEQVNVALSGYQPKISATASAGPQYTDSKLPNVDTRKRDRLHSASVGVTATQPLFDGFRTPNQVQAAEGGVSAAQEVLRVMAQQVLVDATTAYMNVLRDAAIAQLQRHNVEMLEEQLRHTRQRLMAHEVTTTDVSQTESRLAGARWQRLAAESALNASRAAYRRVIGEEQNETLAPPTTVDSMSPPSLSEAVEVALKTNPSVLAAQLGIDVAALQVKIAEGALYPSARLDVSAQQSWGSSVGSPVNSSVPFDRQFSAGAFVTLSVPIYQGGAEYATIRESKEVVGQKRFDLDHVRDQVRGGVVEAWGQVVATKGQIEAVQVQVKAARDALNGVLQEARAGQRTTLDVLNAQQELVNAQVMLTGTQRDRVVTSYTLLASVGRLEPEVLRLPITVADAK